jgi:Gpi18-like mannosyltransferase
MGEINIMPATGKSNNRQELKKNNSVMERLKEFFLGTDKSISITTLAIMLISLVIARLLLSMIRRCQLDADCYAYWSDYLITNNWKDFYQDISYAIYGTVYLYFMWITGHIMKVWQLFFVLINVVGGLFVYFVHKKVDKTNSKKLIPVFYSYIGLIITSIIVVLFLSSSDVPTIKGYMIKMWYVLFDIIGGILIYKIGKRCNKERLGALIGAVYILNPGIFVNSSMWGQLDTIIATMMLLSIYLLSTKRMLAGVAMVVVSLMTKPQAIVVLPVAGVLFLALLPWEKASSNKSWFIKKSLYAIVSSILVALAVYTVLFLPFYNPNVSAVSEGSSFTDIFTFAQGDSFISRTVDFFTWMPNRYFSGVGQYAYATANAFNLWTVMGGQAVASTDPFLGLTYNTWGTIFFLTTVLLTLAFLFIELFRKEKKRIFPLYFAVFFINTGFFTLYTNIHERYLLPSIIFAMVCILWDKRFILVSILISISSFINQYYIYYLANSGKSVWVSRYDWIAVTTAIVTVLVMLYSFYLMISIALNKKTENDDDVIDQGSFAS